MLSRLSKDKAFCNFIKKCHDIILSFSAINQQAVCISQGIRNDIKSLNESYDWHKHKLPSQFQYANLYGGMGIFIYTVKSAFFLKITNPINFINFSNYIQESYNQLNDIQYQLNDIQSKNNNITKSNFAHDSVFRDNPFFVDNPLPSLAASSSQNFLDKSATVNVSFIPPMNASANQSSTIAETNSNIFSGMTIPQSFFNQFQSEMIKVNSQPINFFQLFGFSANSLPDEPILDLNKEDFLPSTDFFPRTGFLSSADFFPTTSLTSLRETDVLNKPSLEGEEERTRPDLNAPNLQFPSSPLHFYVDEQIIDLTKGDFLPSTDLLPSTPLVSLRETNFLNKPFLEGEKENLNKLSLEEMKVRRNERMKGSKAGGEAASKGLKIYSQLYDEKKYTPIFRAAYIESYDKHISKYRLKGKVYRGKMHDRKHFQDLWESQGCQTRADLNAQNLQFPSQPINSYRDETQFNPQSFITSQVNPYVDEANLSAMTHSFSSPFQLQPSVSEPEENLEIDWHLFEAFLNNDIPSNALEEKFESESTYLQNVQTHSSSLSSNLFNNNLSFFSTNLNSNGQEKRKIANDDSVDSPWPKRIAK